MAELAFGAVSSLLGLLRDEAQVLANVSDDMQFIRDEMESMDCFLRHLAKTAPPNGEHEEPVRTWMKQVRDLAFDCSNFIDLYVRRGGGPAVRPGDNSAGLVNYLRSVPSSMRALFAKYQAAAQIRQLKVRARDVGDRRTRYGVELPNADDSERLNISGTTASPSTQAAGDSGGAESAETGPVIIMEASGTVVSDDFIRGVVLGFPEPNILEECTQELVRWLSTDDDDHKEAAKAKEPPRLNKVIAIAAPDEEDGGDVAGQAFDDPSVEALFESKLWLTADSYCQLWYYYRLKWLNWITELSEAAEKGAAKPPEDGAAVKPAEEGAVVKPQEDDAAAKPPEEGAAANTQEDGAAANPTEDAKWVPPEEDTWPAFRDILESVLPSKDYEESAARDDWEEDEIANKIREHLKLEGKRSLIVIDGFNYPEVWPWMQKVLSTFGCAAGSAVVVTTAVDSSEARDLLSQKCITYSLVDFFYKKAAIVIDRTYKKTNDYLSNNLRVILGEIQGRCEPQAFCMKMFVHYLFADPNRTKQELEKLFKMLVSPESSLDNTNASKIREANGKKLLRFCYDDLPRTYRTCLAYLAIFPPGEKIRRSRLVGRWIVEGLITGRDMQHAVREAERCFDRLVNRWFVCPVDIGVSRKVRSCTVKYELVQELIAEIAREEQFLDPRLSRDLAKHFSVHSDLRLRRSNTITEFMQSLRKNSRPNSISHTSSQLKLLKVLDLEGCKDLGNNKQYLKNICNNIVLLKCLSIRNTSVTRLPKEINNLMQLEILDIRQTRVPSSETKAIMLPKLKCLLAGPINWIPSIDNTRAEESVSSADIPRKIKYMTNLEVLSHVEASPGGASELEDIGQLWQLRKLGVGIGDNEDHLKKLLKAISDLNECLQSLSIWIKSPSNIKVPDDALQNPPRLLNLEKLRIIGTTSRQLLPFFFKDDHKLISKVTLHSTMLEESDLETYLAKLPNLRSLRLRRKSYAKSKLTFNKDNFQNLMFLVVECSEITSICFDNEAAPELENIVWSFTTMESLSGIGNLMKLKELEFNGDELPGGVRQDIAAHPKHPVFKHNNQPQNQGQATGSTAAATIQLEE